MSGDGAEAEATEAAHHGEDVSSGMIILVSFQCL